MKKYNVGTVSAAMLYDNLMMVTLNFKEPLHPTRGDMCTCHLWHRAAMCEHRLAAAVQCGFAFFGSQKKTYIKPADMTMKAKRAREAAK